MAPSFFLLRVTNPTTSPDGVPIGTTSLWGANAETAEDAITLVTRMALKGRRAEIVTENYFQADIERRMKLAPAGPRPI